MVLERALKVGGWSLEKRRSGGDVFWAGGFQQDHRLDGHTMQWYPISFQVYLDRHVFQVGEFDESHCIVKFPLLRTVVCGQK